MDYPPNSDTSKSRPQEERKVGRVTTEEPKRRKKPLRKQFSETFVAGDARSAVSYVVFGVLIPAAKEAIAEAGAQGIEKLIFGDSRRRGGSTPPQAGASGWVDYRGIARHAMGVRTGPQMSPRARARHDFDEIVLQSRSEAEDVIDQLFDAVSKYESVSVADLYTMVGIESTHVDGRWGWTNLRGSGVSRVRGGYLLDLPEPQPLG